jgi:hypothetical protein
MSQDSNTLPQCGRVNSNIPNLFSHYMGVGDSQCFEVLGTKVQIINKFQIGFI